ncbi:MAG: type II secretion system protein [Desulfovibrionaceae bacterium]
MTRHRSPGFTLLETIVILILVGVVGSFLASFLGVKLTHAPDVAVIAGQEARVEQIMEHILADYVVQINGANPDGALAAVAAAAKEAEYEALDPTGNTEVEFEYVTFSAGGTEQAGSSSDPTLKVTVYTAIGGSEQHRMTTLLTRSRTNAGGEDVVNY